MHVDSDTYPWFACPSGTDTCFEAIGCSRLRRQEKDIKMYAVRNTRQLLNVNKESTEMTSLWHNKLVANIAIITLQENMRRTQGNMMAKKCHLLNGVRDAI